MLLLRASDGSISARRYRLKISMSLTLDLTFLGQPVSVLKTSHPDQYTECRHYLDHAGNDGTRQRGGLGQRRTVRGIIDGGYRDLAWTKLPYEGVVQLSTAKRRFQGSILAPPP